MIECDGCGHPMEHVFKSHCVRDWPGGMVRYCAVCEFTRWLRSIEPGDHRRGEVSNGSFVMRLRSYH